MRQHMMENAQLLPLFFFFFYQKQAAYRAEAVMFAVMAKH
jgi:hypothetical protein